MAPKLVPRGCRHVLGLLGIVRAGKDGDHVRRRAALGRLAPLHALDAEDRVSAEEELGLALDLGLIEEVDLLAPQVAVEADDEEHLRLVVLNAVHEIDGDALLEGRGEQRGHAVHAA